MTTRTISTFVIALVLHGTALPALAQQHRASVRGRVVDASGTPLSGAEITATHEGTAEVRQVRSDEQGYFAVPELPPGAYRINVTHAGYRAFEGQAELRVGQSFWLDAPLHLSAAQSVEVEGHFIPIDRDSSAMRTVIDERQITGLPLDGRNFLELALLAPGTVPAPQGSAASVRGDFSFSVNGGREDANAYLLDGVYNMDPKLGTSGVRPAVDAIHEFEVLTSTYDSSFGRNAAGQVNVITRSGTNGFDGTAYEFFRGEALAARNFFAPPDQPNPDYSRNQFGLSIGGPVARDRAFFFANYEGTRLKEGTTRVTNVPTLAERRGDFSQSLFARPVDPFTQQPFPNGQLPFVHPVGAAIAALYPEPNRDVPVANFVSSPTLRDDVDQFDVRGDHVFAGGSRLTARYSFGDRRLLEPFGAGSAFSSLPGFGNLVDRRGQNLAMSFVKSLQPTMVNDLRFGYTRVAIGVFVENPQITNQSVGLPALATDPRDAGLSLISVSGYSPVGHEYNNPQESASDTFQVSNTLTWNRGAHLAKFGGEWVGLRQAAYRDVQARGFMQFLQQGYTGNALADLLLGLPVVTGGARLDNPQNLRAHSWSLFAHDDWRATTAVTVSFGLRYDYASPPVDADDRANLYDLTTQQLVAVGTNGMPRGGYESDRNNVAPRAGFAWTLDEEARTVVRGGYGVYYNQGALATSEGLYFNPPYFRLSVFIPGPGRLLTIDDPFPALFPLFTPQSATAYQRDLETPWMQQWNVNVQRQLGATRMVEVAYVGSSGHDLISARDANQADASPRPLNIRPNPIFGDITLIESRASSRYNALQLKFQQRSARGLSLLAAYTLGKSTDDASGFFTNAGDPNFPQNSLDPGAEDGRSSFDVRHRFSLSIAYELPFTGNAFVSDWELQGVATLQSGRPFTVAVHPDIDISNTGRSNLGFGNNDRPDLTGDAELSNRTPDQWFNTAAFSMPVFGRFGNAGRNIVDGPGYRNVNLAVLKHVDLGTGVRLQLRAEAFNLFNNTNFDLPDAFLGSPTFGRILSAQSPRRVQFGVKAIF